MRIFILEDEIYKAPRNAILDALVNHEVTVATSCQHAKEQWGTGQYDLLLLDHDMRGFYDSPDFPNTGTQFVKWLVKQIQPGYKKPRVILHSQNREGRAAMGKVLREAGFKCVQWAFDSYYVKMLEGI